MVEQINNPLISVIMTTLNSERYVKEAIESILAQTYTNWELLIVDGGSVDGTVDIINIIKDPRIELCICDGLRRSAQLNYALHKTAGEFIAIMDSDDISMPERLEKQLDFMRSHKNVTILGSYAQLFSDLHNHIKLLKSPATHEKILHSLMTQEAPFFPTLFFQNVELPYFDEQLSKNVDIEWYVRAAKKAIFANLPVPLVKVRERAGSLSRTPDENNNRVLINAIEKYCTDQINQSPNDSEKELYCLWMGVVNYYYGTFDKTKSYLQKYFTTHNYDSLAVRYWLPAAIIPDKLLHKLRRSVLMHHIADYFRVFYRMFH